MPAWPGGPCPDCGKDMPARLIHCQYCRALLNPDLYRSDVEIPEFFELKEISDVAEAKVAGFHIVCPHCEDELRINRKYQGAVVACKFCQGQFKLDVTDPKIRTRAFYSDCPHCSKEIRLAPKYLDKKVACKHCDGHLQVTADD